MSYDGVIDEVRRLRGLAKLHANREAEASALEARRLRGSRVFAAAMAIIAAAQAGPAAWIEYDWSEVCRGAAAFVDTLEAMEKTQ